MAVWKRISNLGWISDIKRNQLTNNMVSKLVIKAKDVNRPVSSLSGGNQQKVVLGKWLSTSPKILLLDDPTRGKSLY
ncbi:ATP-binding cassette domain-containing protein [Paenibacillus sp. sptzw28]|uniref:ATP-binding cassette domain-containing protein n=1 Tax=Paenibacillus sp. sptzw28 TaxID=715179 RepID=UPI001C6DE31D|nr:ATP-binding cassette domain-containing protein [Paenibacillus sp. sptzw28]QYR19567.1 ATP-binding cassette domain-containing protein [Paenibacillus sp. sptzw28]